MAKRNYLLMFYFLTFLFEIKKSLPLLELTVSYNGGTRCKRRQPDIILERLGELLFWRSLPISSEHKEYESSLKCVLH